MTATEAAINTANFDVAGMTCASCVAHVEKAVRAVTGVKDCRVNLARGRAVVTYDPGATNERQIASEITRQGYSATVEQAGAAGSEEGRKARQQHEAAAWFNRAVVGIVLWLPLELTHWIWHITSAHAHHEFAAQSTLMGWANLIASSVAMVYVGGRFFSSAVNALKRGTSNMDTLISMGASVAYGYSLTYFTGGLMGAWLAPATNELFFMEASGLLALISLGHWLEARARQSAGSAIRELLELAPAVALRDEAGSFSEVPVSMLAIKDRVLIRPGDRIPIDGVVVEGQSSVDESMITGEAVPVTRHAGDSVIGGTINQEGRLVIRVTKTGSDTALAQIVQLVEHAQSSKPPVQQLADRISAVFVPSVLAIALVTALGWYAWGHHAGWNNGQIWSNIARATCSVLIIACPCALGLAVPATVMVSAGRGARRGILIRDIDALQKAEKIDTVVLDKTGTITTGKPAVIDVMPVAVSTEEELLRLAASAEQFSGHPLAKAIVAAARQRDISLETPSNFTNIAGAGVVAEFGQRRVIVGNDALLRENGVLEASTATVPGATTIHVAATSGAGLQRLGVIVLADELKPDSASAISALQELNLNIVLLTGDNISSANKVAGQVGIRTVHAEVKPSEKAAVIRSLQQPAAQQKRYVAMVGDGINDAPALATADLGIAVGGGSDIAKEAGDIVLVSGSLLGVAAAIRLSRATMTKIRQNLFLAFIYNVIAIPIAAFGLLNPLVAAGAMALSDVTVIGNALTLRWKRIE